MSYRTLELHTFRLPRRRWELGLLRLRQLGADAVCVPLPWAWHQPAPGVYDFGGATHPGRDVVEFLELCRDLVLPVCLRVGPYVGAGLLGGGVPPWLMQANPGMHALGPDRRPLRDRRSGSPLPCAEQPDYLAAVTEWYQQLTEALAGCQQPEGPIFAVQTDGPTRYEVATPDAELPPGLQHDYNPHVAEVLWPVWLRGRYGDIGALNAAWGTTYPNFKDVPLSSVPGDEAARFFGHVVARAEATYARRLRELGWRVPVVSAIESPPWEEVAPGHLMTSDEEPPEISAAVIWAPDAPVRSDGWARRRFWEIKAAWVAARAGDRPAPNALVITRADAGAVRLPRRYAGGAACRLLLNGRLLDVPGAELTASVRLDYVVEDAAGQTDLVIVCRDRNTPLTGWPADYLRHLLRHTGHRLERAAAMCQAAAETLAGATPGRSEATSDVAASSLAEAQRAAERAARSVYRLEMVRDAVLARSKPVTAAASPREWTLTAEQLGCLTPLREGCGRAAGMLRQGIGGLSLAEMTPAAYQAARRQADAAAAAAGALLQPLLAGLRADLAAGALPSGLMALERWLVEVLVSGDLCSTSE